MNKILFLTLVIFITGCDVGGMPTNVNLTCNDLLGFPENDVGRDYPIVSQDSKTEVIFTANIEKNSLDGSDGTSTKFSNTDGFVHTYVNSDESGSISRVVSIYPVDMEIKIKENDVARRLSCSGSPG